MGLFVIGLIAGGSLAFAGMGVARWLAKRPDRCAWPSQNVVPYEKIIGSDEMVEVESPWPIIDDYGHRLQRIAAIEVGPRPTENLRKAITFALDRDAITDDVLKDGSAPCYTAVPPQFATGPDGSDFSADQTKFADFCAYDADKAKEIGRAHE